jgi:ABC-type transport system involved in cytochrome c biogenesis permease subunit
VVVELLFRNSVAIVVGTTTGALSLMIAHFLSLDGDTLGMLQAVLDTNFWLATHVVCITLGYTASFVAGFMGIAYIVLGVFTPLLARGNATALNKMIYGVICFAMFLSFTGTVLGGIWADQSWGRFWGWDPKENGALLIVIWNAPMLHARWGGMVKQRGLAQLAVLGNAVTAWSWFGTNLLGVGLHAYGFMQGAMHWLIFACLVMVAICCVGFIPLRHWRSFQPQSQPRGPLPAMP